MAQECIYYSFLISPDRRLSKYSKSYDGGTMSEEF